ncbi:hypothetical protein OG883_44080 [Streptomyces sp. NBC_01142]|uniref:hypothetical protein n=1 Tax=Streptomyces sp. NBC_01142 TaxID=2975865 RepID=UPI002257E7B0|nr:hypothetical protein [Streptomyces sp. NBC_01142]MCX4826622.1 hypothetical protein [Streptomyces sp. NBC_01142]
MSEGWTILAGIAAAAVAWFLVAACRAAAQLARRDTRQDLIKLGGIPETSKTLTEMSRLPTYALAAPFASGRSNPFGWLWWRVEPTADGTTRREMGWALTYRGARKAAGLPLSFRAQHAEIIMAPGHQAQPHPE